MASPARTVEGVGLSDTHVLLLALAARRRTVHFGPDREIYLNHDSGRLETGPELKAA